jgi:GNAT superfamily N-acetyltransferase
MTALRPARPGDAGTIAACHLACWAETYAHLAPPEVMAAHTLESRTRQWAQTLARAAPPPEGVFVLEDAAGLAGFGRCGPQGTPGLEAWEGEVKALYLRQRVQRRGGGRALMRAMAGCLVAGGIGRCTLWVLTANGPARAFYATLGGRIVARKETRLGAEVALAWDRPEPLLG